MSFGESLTLTEGRQPIAKQMQFPGQQMRGKYLREGAEMGSEDWSTTKHRFHSDSTEWLYVPRRAKDRDGISQNTASLFAQDR